MAAPLLLTIGVALAVIRFAFRDNVLEGSRIPLWILVADLGIFALAWILISTAPDLTTSNGVCKNLRDFDAFYPLVLGSAVGGGFAWGTASLQQSSSWARLVAYAVVAMAIPYAIAIRAVFASACGWN